MHPIQGDQATVQTAHSLGQQDDGLGRTKSAAEELHQTLLTALGQQFGVDDGHLDRLLLQRGLQDLGRRGQRGDGDAAPVGQEGAVQLVHRRLAWGR